MTDETVESKHQSKIDEYSRDKQLATSYEDCAGYLV